MSQPFRGVAVTLGRADVRALRYAANGTFWDISGHHRSSIQPNPASDERPRRWYARRSRAVINNHVVSARFRSESRATESAARSNTPKISCKLLSKCADSHNSFCAISDRFAQKELRPRPFILWRRPARPRGRRGCRRAPGRCPAGGTTSASPSRSGGRCSAPSRPSGPQAARRRR